MAVTLEKLVAAADNDEENSLLSLWRTTSTQERQTLGTETNLNTLEACIVRAIERKSDAVERIMLACLPVAVCSAHKSHRCSSPIAWAVRKRRIRLVKYYLDRGVDAAGVNSLLQFAADVGAARIVELLLNLGAVHSNESKEYRDLRFLPDSSSSSKPPRQMLDPTLFAACYNSCDLDGDCERRLRIVQSLLAAGADPNQTSKSQQLPLDMAAISYRVDIVEALVSAGANVHSITSDSSHRPQVDTMHLLFANIASMRAVARHKLISVENTRRLMLALKRAGGRCGAATFAANAQKRLVLGAHVDRRFESLLYMRALLDVHYDDERECAHVCSIALSQLVQKRVIAHDFIVLLLRRGADARQHCATDPDKCTLLECSVRYSFVQSQLLLAFGADASSLSQLIRVKIPRKSRASAKPCAFFSMDSSDEEKELFVAGFDLNRIQLLHFQCLHTTSLCIALKQTRLVMLTCWNFNLVDDYVLLQILSDLFVHEHPLLRHCEDLPLSRSIYRRTQTTDTSEKWCRYQCDGNRLRIRTDVTQTDFFDELAPILFNN